MFYNIKFMMMSVVNGLGHTLDSLQLFSLFTNYIHTHSTSIAHIYKHYMNASKRKGRHNEIKNNTETNYN